MTGSKCRPKSKYKVKPKEMHMKKTTAILLILCLMISVCACSNSTKGSSETAPAETSADAADTKQETAAEKETAENKQEETTAVENAESEESSEIEYSSIIHASIAENTETKTDSETYVRLASVEYPEVILSEEDAERFPELEAGLKAQNEQYRTSAQNQLNELYGYAKEAYADYDRDSDMDFIAFEDITHQSVARADEKVFSLYNDYFNFSGGVHGYYAYWGNNYDVETGKELEITDVITDIETYKNTVLEKLSAQYPELNLELAIDNLSNLGHEKEDEGTLPFLLGYEGITCYFNPYAIGSYADGAQMITVMFNEAPEIFNEKYIQIPDSYVTPLPADTDVWIDINNDGVIEFVNIRQNYLEDYEEGNYACSWTLTCNGKDYKIKDYCYDQESYVVKNDGHYYAYVFQLSDNDYRILRVIDLETMSDNGEEPTNKSIAGGGFDYEDLKDGYRHSAIKPAFTDPKKFVMSTVVDALGTMSGIKTYYVGEKGLPECDLDYYTTDTTLVLEAKEEVECKLVDADEKELGEAKLTKRTYYQVIRTDNKTWVDIQEVEKSLVNDVTEDYGDYSYRTITEENFEADMTKPIYRLETKLDEWPRLINGEEEENLFEGIRYAG